MFQKSERETQISVDAYRVFPWLDVTVLLSQEPSCKRRRWW